ncbi:VOC family protein [Streptomyces sp. NBC_01352]|uniref:VOC family protein n=1 Tax=Streptomyces sp. NBC_01352 TaxID=2903834 RepID=UPI002E2ED62B|nr:VOC family protein [Streptomyces sp. NBC_01352]
MTQRLITHLRHIDLAVPDAAKQLAFYTGVWGLTTQHTDSGVTYLAAEGSPEQYVVRIRESDDKRIDVIAFGAQSPADVDTLAAQLASAGVRLVSEPGPLQTPGGGYGFRFFDNEGRTVETSSGVATRRHRAIEERESIPVRLSHVVINSADPEGTVAFYEQHLGFALSDTLTHPAMGPIMYFMRVNSWHHSLAIARSPHPALNHVSFEMRGIDEYLRGTGRLLRAGVEKIWGPGRHLAGDNSFSYFLDPSGNVMEYTTALEVIDEDVWHPRLCDVTQPDVIDQWGTADAMNEFITVKMFNDADKGLFVPPPV